MSLRVVLLMLTVWLCGITDFAVAANRDSATVQQTVEDVLSAPEYRHLRQRESKRSEDLDLPEWLENVFEWLFDSPDDTPTDQSSIEFGGTLAKVLLWGLAIAAVICLVIYLKDWKTWHVNAGSVRPFDDDEDREAINPSRPAGDIPVDEYQRRALSAADSGDYRSAIRELVLGAMSWTERGGLIRHRRGLTNRDYVRAIWRQTDRRESLLQIVVAFERIFYGHRPADELTFESCLDEFRKSFALEVSHAQPTS